MKTGVIVGLSICRDQWTTKSVRILKLGCSDPWTAKSVRFLIGMQRSMDRHIDPYFKIWIQGSMDWQIGPYSKIEIRGSMDRQFRGLILFGPDLGRSWISQNFWSWSGPVLDF